MGDHSIGSVRAVFGSDKAIRSQAPGDDPMWFYRDPDTREFVAIKPAVQSDTHTVDLDTVEANINHRHTDVDTAPVDESPFAE